MATCAIPAIDPNVKHVGVSKLRDLNASKLKEQHEETLVIQENDTPLAVLLSYDRFQQIREEFNAMLSMIELLTDDKEKNNLTAAFEDIRNHRIRSLSEIEADMEQER